MKLVSAQGRVLTCKLASPGPSTVDSAVRPGAPLEGRVSSGQDGVRTRLAVTLAQGCPRNALQFVHRSDVRRSRGGKRGSVITFAGWFCPWSSERLTGNTQVASMIVATLGGKRGTRATSRAAAGGDADPQACP